MQGRKRASRRAFSPAQEAEHPFCPGVPAQLTPGEQGPKPRLPQEESREEPGTHRLFSLNGIDYFCNQHLVAKTEHPLLQDSKTKITQGREKDIIQKLSCSQTVRVGSVPSRGSKPAESTQSTHSPVPRTRVAPARRVGRPERGCCISPRRCRATSPAGRCPMGHTGRQPRRSLAALESRQHSIPHPASLPGTAWQRGQPRPCTTKSGIEAWPNVLPAHRQLGY